MAYVGSSPMAVVAPDISSKTRIRVGRRPIRSPSRPNRAAPIGRKKKASAKDAYVLIRASRSVPPAELKKFWAMIVARKP